MCDVLSECLSALVKEKLFTVEELAPLVPAGTSAFYRWMNDDGEPRANGLLTLQRYTSDRGDLRLVRLGLSPKYRIVPAGESRADGVIDDEVTDATLALAAAAEAHRRGDGAAMDAALARHDAVRERLGAERQRLST